MSKETTVVVIEDKESMAQMLVRTLEEEGYRALAAPTGEEGLAAALEQRADVVLTDLKLPGMDGLEVLKALREKRPFVPVIMMTAHGSIKTAVEAVKAGAYDFLTKPFDTSHMLVLIKRAAKAGRLEAENLVLRHEFAESLGFPKIIGASPALMEVVSLVKKAAPTNATVLITGESGTGKELFARALHHLSARSDGPFVAINCAAIPKDLMESELFGHEKGAFTGAQARRPGKFELADNGTIFLDEVGEMDLTLQAKLLRVLQGERIERVGGTEEISVDVRVVAASNKDLARAVAEGKFREDLFYRLNVFPVAIPPLRDRAGDVPLLARFFAKKYCEEMKKPAAGVSDDALRLLSGQGWKGNVRELENCIERAVILADGGLIAPEHLALAPAHEPPTPAPAAGGAAGGLQEVAGRAARAAEYAAIRKALDDFGGNKTKAARALGVSYKTLLTKIKELGIV